MATAKEVQQALIARGYSIAADGQIGPKTLAAMMSALERIPVSPAPAPTAVLPEPAWLVIARNYLGQKEKAGPQHNPYILKWWKDIGAPFKDDETPWCGAFVGGVLVEAGLTPVSGGAAARNWLNLKVKLDKPAVGAVVIFWRGSKTGSAGHVGFVVGRDKSGNLMVLGGNQGNAVSIAPFDKARVLGYRWPSTYPREERFNLPIIASDGKVSTNEA